VGLREKTNKGMPKTYTRVRRQVRLKLWFKDHQWPFLFVLTLVTLYLGSIGFKEHSEIGKDLGFFDALYRTLQLFVLHSIEVHPPVPWELQVARFLAPAIAAYAAVIALMVVLREQVQLIRLRSMKDHIVICGLGRIGSHLTRAFTESGYRVVTIEKNPENNNLSFCRDHRIITLIGDATDRWLLCKAKTEKAKYLFCVCNDDAINIEVALAAQEVVSEHNTTILTCFVHILNLELCNLLREKQLLEQRTHVFRWEFFNIFEAGARTLLKAFPPFGRPEGPGEDQAHMLLVGLGHMGESLVMRAIRDWRDLHRDDSERLQITMIDRQANSLKESLHLRYPQIQRYCDLTSQQIEVETSEFLKYYSLLNLNLDNVTIIYVCSDDDSTSFSSAFTLNRRITAQGRRVKIVVRMSEEVGLGKLLPRGGEDAGEPEDLYAFSVLQQTCKPDLLLGGVNETLARALHEGYIRNQRLKGESQKTNPSMVPWELLPESLKESNRYEVDYLVDRLKPFGYRIVPLTDWDAESLDFPPEIVEKMARIEHERWYEQMSLVGYKFAPGPRTGKTHPDLLPWEDISDGVKQKDRNIVRGLPWVLAKAGFQLTLIPGLSGMRP
jgi:hypothetical protein